MARRDDGVHLRLLSNARRHARPGADREDGSCLPQGPPERGERVVEAGCGWGALALHMARHYGVKVTRVQYLARADRLRAAARAGSRVSRTRCEFVEDDYRNITRPLRRVRVGRHARARRRRELSGARARRSADCLKDSGRGLIHTIGRNRAKPMHRWIDRRIFPGAHPPSLKEMMDIFEGADFSVLDVENIRLHYAKTLEWWQHAVRARRRQRREDVRRALRADVAAVPAGFAGGVQRRRDAAVPGGVRAGRATTRSRGRGPTSISDERARTTPTVLRCPDRRRRAGRLVVCARSCDAPGSTCSSSTRASSRATRSARAGSRRKSSKSWSSTPSDYAQGRVLQPISSFVTGMGERAAKPVHYDKIVSYGIRRCEFDHLSAAALRRAPAAWRSVGVDGARRRSLAGQRRDLGGAGDRRGRSLLSGGAFSRRESRQGRARHQRAGNRVRDER